jgi:outer membrane receptor for ferrienterochelin and colicins
MYRKEFLMKIPGFASVLAMIACLLTVLVSPLAARAGDIKGTVSEALASTPLPDTEVTIIDTDGKVAGRVVTDRNGQFSLSDLAGERYTAIFSKLGYERLRVSGVRPRMADDPGLSVTLNLLFSVADTVVVTASRQQEADLAAPASMSVVQRLPIYEKPQYTPVDITRDIAGVDFASKGISQHSFTVRGLNGGMSGTMLTLTDYRYAAIPVLEFNLSYLMPESSEDIQRIEILRGPNASMYGPNANQGVMHIITRSPFESQGTSVSLTGGEREVYQGAFRHAGVIDSRIGFKISGEYFRGNDWEYRDPREEAKREAAISNGADPATLLIGRRDFGVEHGKGEARVDWKLGEETMLNIGGGMAQAINTIDLANSVGALQIKDWRNSFLQSRFEHKKFNASLVYNVGDMGDTYVLRTGQLLVDKSRIITAQMQYGYEIAGRSDLTYGVDVRRSDPRTEGTIHGRYEKNDIMSEFGGYVTSSTAIAPMWDFIASLRVDYHDRINDLAVSPRVGLIVEPVKNQSLRFTYNRAFNSPKAIDLFLDMFAGELLPGMDLRLLAPPKDGFNFSTECNGDLCMRSPFAAGGVGETLPVDATQFWDVLVQFLGSSFPELSTMPAPNASQVSSDLRYLDLLSGGYADAVSQDEVRGIDQDKRRITNTFEIGYKGTVRKRAYLMVDLNRTEVEDYYGELYAVTPNVFFNQADLAAYFESTGGMSPQDATAAAAAAYGIPLGTVAPDELESADVLLWNRIGGEYTTWGVDVAGEFKLTRSLSMTGTYSWINDTEFMSSLVGPKVLSVPRNKGSAGLAYRGIGNGFDGGVQFRAVEQFPVVSGVFKGTVESYAVFDMTLGYRLPGPQNVRISLNAQNILDNRHQEFVGAPELGRLLVARVQYTF